MADIHPEQATVEPLISEEKTGSDGEVDAPEPEAPVPLMSRGTRNFTIGCLIGLIVNCVFAFGFFLMVEDNPRTLLSVGPVSWLKPGLIAGGVLVVLALVVRRGWWKAFAGYALAMLVVAGFTANWALNSHPIPTEAEMCAALREVYAVFEESEAINANTPAAEAMAWRSKMVDVWKGNFKTLQFVRNPNTGGIDLLQKEYEALKSRDRTGRIAYDIHTKVAENKRRLRRMMAQPCSGE